MSLLEQFPDADQPGSSSSDDSLQAAIAEAAAQGHTSPASSTKLIRLCQVSAFLVGLLRDSWEISNNINCINHHLLLLIVCKHRNKSKELLPFGMYEDQGPAEQTIAVIAQLSRHTAQAVAALAPMQLACPWATGVVIAVLHAIHTTLRLILGMEPAFIAKQHNPRLRTASTLVVTGIPDLAQC
jgi:hypothetical protein